MTATVAAGGPTISEFFTAAQKWQFSDVVGLLPALRSLAARIGKWLGLGFLAYVGKRTLDAIYGPFVDRWFLWIRSIARKVANFFHLYSIANPKLEQPVKG